MFCCHHEGHNLLRNFGIQVTQNQKTPGFNSLETAKLSSNPATRSSISSHTADGLFCCTSPLKMRILSLEQQRQICDVLGNDTGEALEPMIRTNGSLFNNNTQHLNRSEASKSCANGSSLIQAESQAGIMGFSPSSHTAREITATNCSHNGEGVQRVMNGEKEHSYLCEDAQKEELNPFWS